MDILFLAPHPFYQDRGTPIAANLVLRALCERGCRIDLVTYHEGKDIEYNCVNLHRIFNIPFVRDIRPGFSWKKLVCDFFMFFKVLSLVLRKRYHIVHAVEESVFIALFLKFLFRIPYVYDMDSSLSQQLIEKYPVFAFINPLLKSFEMIAIKNGEAVVPVCDSLADIVKKYNPRKLLIVRDVSLLSDDNLKTENNLKKELGINGLVIMYVGNLEAYQGVDLLLESFALVLEQSDEADLVIIGGAASDIEKYKNKCRVLGISVKVHFLGPKPVESLNDYLSQADILVSPRIKGNNTPMKIYSYLHSGKVVLATNLPTHTQVFDNHVALLAAPFPKEFSNGLLCLIKDQELRLRLGENGKNLVEEKYSYKSFKEEINHLYDWLEMRLRTKKDVIVGSS